ncbi:MAG: hypothetical protein EP330_19410 [Deltaproteobacteria bacterium]|nr:MAG: hypothetical protein EP330_19410 [Deltaproteobacteria bacterium]
MRSIILLLALTGCVYSSAVKRGDAALAAQDYDAARRAYGFALDVKDDARASEGLAKAKAGWIEAKLSDATAAAGRGEHAQAAKMIQEVELLAPEAEGLEAARTAAQGSMLAALATEMTGLDDDLQGTYEFAAMAKALYPGLPETNEAIATAREAVKAKAEAQLEEEAFADARATAAIIATIEPGYAGVAYALDDRITLAWADDLVAQGDKALRKQPGLASVHYARAFELRGRSDDMEKRDMAWTEAAESAPIAVLIEDQGGGGRPARLRRGLTKAVEDDLGVERGYSSRWDLKAKIYAPDLRCRETKEAEPQTKDYIKGQKEVENPEHTAQLATTEAAEAAESAAQADVDRLTPLAEEANATLAELEAKLATQKSEVTATTELLGQTTGQRDSAVAEVAKLEAEIAALPPEAKKSHDELTAKLETQKGFVTEWEERVVRDTTALAEFKAGVAATEADIAKAKPEAEKLSKELTTATEKLAETSKAHSDAKATLANLSPTLMEDIPATLEYDKVTWTNTCTGKATVYMAGRWEHGLESPAKFELTTSSTDVAIKGHEKAEVAEDPKAYPKSEKELQAELEAQTMAKLEELVATWEDNYFSTTVTRAFEGGDTDTLVRIFAGIRERMTKEQRQAFREHVASMHGLEDFAKLDPRPPLVEEEPAPAEAEGETKAEGAEGEAKAEGVEGEAKAEGAEGEAKAEETSTEDGGSTSEEATGDGEASADGSSPWK